MKKSFLLLVFFCFSVAGFAYPPLVNEKVLKVFKAGFPDVVNEVWTEFENVYQVYFIKDETQCRVYYDFNGNIIKCRRDYSREKLNPFLTAKLTKNFPGKSIYLVTEISDDFDTFYIINLQDQKQWTQVRCESNGATTVLNKFSRE